jgi:hypothetical protein
MLARWLGKPSVAIGGSLWNIPVAGLCAALLNRSVGATALPGYADAAERRCAAVMRCVQQWFVGGDGTKAFSPLRDSLYILTVVNLFGLDCDHYVPDVGACLRFALFYNAARGSKTGPGNGAGPPSGNSSER